MNLEESREPQAEASSAITSSAGNRKSQRRRNQPEIFDPSPEPAAQKAKHTSEDQEHEPGPERLEEEDDSPVEPQLVGSENWTDMEFDEKIGQMPQEQLRALSDYYGGILVSPEAPSKIRQVALRRRDEIGVRLQKITQQASPQSDTSWHLGTNPQSLGYGSSAKDHKSEVDDKITSLTTTSQGRKGRMLSHYFYRRFLIHYYRGKLRKIPIAPAGPAKKVSNEDDTRDDGSSRKGYLEIKETTKKHFETLMAKMNMSTDVGLVSTKNKSGDTPEPCQTSIFGAIVNQLIARCGETEGHTPVWVSEYPYFREGNEEDKNPRQDGNLALPDPLNNGALRPLVSYEAKLHSFEPDGRYESRSNAMDAISRNGKGKTKTWPLLVIRHSLLQRKFDVYAMSPTNETHFCLTPMLTCEEVPNLLRVIVACSNAAIDFFGKVKKDQRAPDFCEVGRNVCLQKETGEKLKIFKSFIGETLRSPNLALYRQYVGKEVTEWVFENDVGSILEMPYLGPVLPRNKVCRAKTFVGVAQTIRKMHEDGVGHGDIHLENMILSGREGRLIDFDFGGVLDEQTYPPGLIEFDPNVGKRHEEVNEAIRKGDIQNLSLRKEHDWASFSAVLQLFRPVEVSNESDWASFSHGPQLLLTASASALDFDVKYSCKGNKAGVMPGTGSPEQ